jgi:hypothetical protein
MTFSINEKLWAGSENEGSSCFRTKTDKTK